MTDRRNRAATLAWVSAVFAAALLAGALALVFLRPTGDAAQTTGVGEVLFLGLGLAFAIVGALIVTRRGGPHRQLRTLLFDFTACLTRGSQGGQHGRPAQ